MVSPSTKSCWDWSQPEARLAIAKGDRISTASAVQKAGFESDGKKLNDLEAMALISLALEKDYAHAS